MTTTEPEQNTAGNAGTRSVLSEQNGAGVPPAVDLTSDSDHRAALAQLRTKTAMVRYACEHLGHPTTEQVRAWLSHHGVETSRRHVSTEVNVWRRSLQLSDTGDLPALSTEVLAELDAAHEAQNTAENAGASVPAPVTSFPATDAGAASPSPSVPPNADRSISGTASGIHTIGSPTDDSVTVPPPVPPAVPSRPPGLPDSGTRTARQSTRTPERGKWVVAGLYAGALLSTLVSLNTSWRFFGRTLHITDLHERAVLFFVVEFALIMCGAGMAASVRATGKPGSFRTSVWIIAGAAAYGAVTMSDNLAEGAARVIVGPCLGVLLLHHALGLEMRAHHHRTGALARIGRELRERFLSRLGLGDDARDAIQRTRDRASQRVAHLTLGHWVFLRQARLRRAIRTAGVAHDPTQRERMLAELDAERHIHQLATLDRPSPWTP